MCEAIRIPLSEFSDDQVKRNLLFDFVSEGEYGVKIVTFRRPGKPSIIPYLYNGRLQLAPWSESVKTTELENLATYYGQQIQKPKSVIIPALMAYQNGIWFDVAPKQIGGIMKRGRKVSVSILVKPASDYYERMTHFGWEPVYVGEDADPAKTDWERKKGSGIIYLTPASFCPSLYVHHFCP